MIATQFSETKRRELAKIKQELREACSSSSTLQDSMSFTGSIRSGKSNQSQSNIYTQVFDLLVHSSKRLVSIVKNRSLKKPKHRRKHSTIARQSVDDKITTKLIKIETCDDCKSLQNIQPAPVKSDSSNSDVFVTPATSPSEFERPVVATKQSESSSQNEVFKSFSQYESAAEGKTLKP